MNVKTTMILRRTLVLLETLEPTFALLSSYTSYRQHSTHISFLLAQRFGLN
jgi:hypothetical protein